MIEVRGLHFTYPGAGEEALAGLDFAVEDGEIFGFLGPSGAGKSTTQKVLIGMLPGFVGQVQVFGQDVRGLGRDYYQRIGVGFELPNVYSRLTGRENLEFFAALYRGPTASPRELLARVGLADAADRRVAGPRGGGGAGGQYRVPAPAPAPLPPPPGVRCRRGRTRVTAGARSSRSRG